MRSRPPVTLPGKDPAGILETEGATTLRKILHDRALPLSAIVIDAYLDPWERRLRDPEGPLLAMRSTATLIAALLPRETAQAIRQITGNAELQTLDERMQPVTNPALWIARTLPADHAYQIVRTAERLGFTDYSDVLAEVANAVTRKAARPKGDPHDPAPHLAGKSFPHPSPTIQSGTDPAPARSSGSRTGPKPAQTIRRPAS